MRGIHHKGYGVYALALMNYYEVHPFMSDKIAL